MAEIDSLEIKITANAEKANTAIRHLTRSLGALSTSLKFDTSNLEKLGKINGNNFKKLGEGLQSFANAAKSLHNVDSNNFKKLADGLTKIASIDSSKLEALGKIDGNSFRGLGEGVKALSSGLQNLQGIKKSDFNRLATGIERLAAISTGNIQEVGNALRPLADGVNILSNAKFDNKNLQSLINSLTRLANANTGSLANIDFTTLGNSINGLAQTLSKAEEVKQNTISMTNAIAKLASAGENANIVAYALPNLGSKLSQFMDIMSRAKTVEADTISFTQAIGTLASAGKRAENVANALPKLGEELSKFFQTMSNVPKVSENTIRMTQALAQFANAGGRAGSAASNLNGRINTLSFSMNGLRGTTAKAVSGLKSFGKQILSSMGVYLGIYGAIRGIKSAIDISSDLTEVQNVVDVTFGNMSAKVEEFAQDSIKQLGMSELSVKQYASRFQAMGTAMGISSENIGKANKFLEEQTNGYIGLSDSLSDVSLNMTKLTADLASFYDMNQSDVAKDLESIFTGMVVPLRTYGLDLTQATLEEWAHKQGIDAKMKSMSQAEKTMLRYQYVMANTTAAQGDFARTSNTWANQVRILKQNFQQLAGIVGGTLINAFKPLIQALNSVMGKVIAFAETVTNALGSIFGWQFESGGTGGIADDFSGIVGDSEDVADNLDNAAGGAGGTAENLGDAAKNIEKMNKGIRKFDELINITMPETNEDSGNGGGGGGKKPSGGGSGAGSGGAKGSLVKTDTIFDKYKSDIDSLYELGEYIGDALSKAMESIDWDSVYEKARNFGKGLAEFLNGLISPRLFGNIGKTIAGALNTALHFLDSFGETFDWKNFGLSIASGINSFFSAFDFALLASAINKWVQGVWTTLKTAISNINWKDVWNGVKEFLNNIDLETVAIIIGALTIKKILGLHLASSALSFIGATLSKKIAQAIAGKLGVEIAANAGIGTALATGLKAAFSSISGLGILDIGTVLGAGTLVEKFAFISKMIGGIGLVIGGLITAVKNFFSMWENGWNVVGEILKDVGIALTAIGAVILGVAAAPAAIVAAVVAAVSTIVIVIHDNWNTICEWFSGVAEWINTNVIQPVIGFFKGFWTSVSGFFSNLWNDIIGVWSLVSGWFNENVITPVVGFFQGLWLRIKQIFEGLWIIIQAIWIKVSGWFNENVITPVVGFFQGLWESVSGFFKKLWGDIQSIWITVSGWFKTNVTEPVTRFFKGVWTNVKGYFTNLWSNIKGVWKDVSGWFKRTVITPVQNAWKTATDKIKGFFTSLWNSIKTGVKSAFNSVIASIESGINAIVNGINTAINGFNRVAQWAANVVGVNYGGVSPVPNVSLPRLEKGGITLKHIFAEIGEYNKPEAVLPLTNKRTMGMIADSILENASYNNYSNGYENDYIRQVEEATYRGTMRAIREAGGIKADVTFQVEGDPNRIFRVTQKEAEDFFKRTGRPAYSF